MMTRDPGRAPRCSVGVVVASALVAVFLGCSFVTWIRDVSQDSTVRRMIEAHVREQQRVAALYEDHIAAVYPLVSTFSHPTRRSTPPRRAWVERMGHRGPAHVCQYAEAEVREALARPHSCGPGEARYFYAGVWMTWEFLRYEAMVCVMACSYREVLQCSKARPCIHAFHLRRSESDLATLHRLYDGDPLPVLQPDLGVRTVLDAGAGAGILSVLLACMYPTAVLVATEASESGFRALSLNTAPYDNAIALRAALWSHVTSLVLRVEAGCSRFIEVEQHAAGSLLNASSSAAVTGLSGSFLLQFLGLRRFDVVRINMEGNARVLLNLHAPHDSMWLLAGPRLVAFDSRPEILALTLPADASQSSPAAAARPLVAAFYGAQSPPAYQEVKEGIGAEYIVFRRRTSG
ncbi:hypothetical protein CLOP_g4745 [Closterium sp. NIES-67]|nr:hypothetical protein CLOP_g4745 [Closterium sp. NIES-67]